MPVYYDGIFCIRRGFSSHMPTFDAFQQPKIKPVNLVNPVKKQYCKPSNKNKYKIYEILDNKEFFSRLYVMNMKITHTS
jgi:hypothetical protein